MRSLYLYLTLALCACHPQASKDTDLPDVVSVDCSGLRIINEFLMRPALGSVESVTPSLPDSYYDTDKRFAVATTKFADHKFLDAARDFLFVAKRLDDAARDVLAVTQRLGLNAQVEVFRRDRLTAYENAAIAYQEANALDEGRRELTQRAHQDLECAVDLERIVRGMRHYDCEHAK